ncbi:MAG: glycosyltransferase [bacterium]|nr:glycosyltransferase [bacterium]
MGKYRICVYAICKNEEKYVERWVKAVSEADLIVVTDTGSTDRTVELLRKNQVTVYEEKIVPWRFDVARNIAMDHIPEDVDICVSNDLDEIFEPGWRDKLEQVWEKKHTRARYMFRWSYHADGTPDKEFVMEKIHRRNGFRWVHPVHEVLEYDGKDPDCYVDVFSIHLNHYPDPNKSRGQYLPLLELSAKENPKDGQTVFWLGREYMFYGKFHEAINTLKAYLALESAMWEEERSAAYRFIGFCYLDLGIKEEAKSYFYRAIGECPYVREPYMAMARFAFDEEDWRLLFYVTDRALSVTMKTGSYLMETECYGPDLDDYAAIACYYMGLYEKAVLHENRALSLDPENERLVNNLKLIMEKVEA